ncbi:hypothetical protein [Nostoc sp. CMAA1605]|uniref:hypothetical protein n=1 Tax=Nostoc sp. CMAA1605 TaxID=2055159 RepID=UPI001F3E27F5|nr:hypothetical protein [Nostoc sp. CMAA1605]MCF4970127.1 hypothetical protein [Nostoc sp. CMAA1605]
MKDKQKNLQHIDWLIELTPSEQEQINGGSLTSTQDTDPNGRPAIAPTPLPPPPQPEGDLYPKLPGLKS